VNTAFSGKVNSALGIVNINHCLWQSHSWVTWGSAQEMKLSLGLVMTLNITCTLLIATQFTVADHSPVYKFSHKVDLHWTTEGDHEAT